MFSYHIFIPVNLSCFFEKEDHFIFASPNSTGQGGCSFIILIYVVLRWPWREFETKCAVVFHQGWHLLKKMDHWSAVHSAFVAETLKNNKKMQ